MDGAAASAGDHSERENAHLRVEGVVKNFGPVRALTGVDLEVRRSEVVGLVGDNGAGKSTLMKIISGVEAPDSGRIFLGSEEVSLRSPHDAAAAGIQIVFQDLALCENLDVTANLFLGDEQTAGGWARVLPRMLRPLANMDMEERAKEAVAKLNVRTLKSVGQKVGLLSGGQRQTVAIARAMRAHSTVVLLDEPTAALGIAQTAQVLNVVRRLRENEHAVIYISHNLRDIFEVCDRIAVLRHGACAGMWNARDVSPDDIVSAMMHDGKRQGGRTQ